MRSFEKMNSSTQTPFQLEIKRIQEVSFFHFDIFPQNIYILSAIEPGIQPFYEI